MIHKCDLHETLQVVNSILQVKLPYTFLILASFNLFEFFDCHFGEGSITCSRCKVQEDKCEQVMICFGLLLTG